LAEEVFRSVRLTRRALLAGVAVAAPLLPFAGRGVAAQEATPGTAPTSSLGWSDSLDQDNGKLNVATTVAPLSSIVRNVGGTRINLHGIIPDGVDSHTFEPAPSDAKVLSKADLIIVNGLHLEQPTVDLANANLKEGAQIEQLGENTIGEDQWVFDYSFPKDKGDPNPHLWMNVAYAENYAKLAAQWLSERDQANADYYGQNRDRYLAVLDRLDQGIMASVQTIPEQNRKLLTYHDSFAYFAQRYGMTVIGAVQPSDFSEPSPQEVAALIDQIKLEGVPAIFGSEVYPSTVLEQIARETGAQYVDKLRDDASPGEPGEPGHTYVGMMLEDMRLMIPALGGNVDALAAVEPYDTYLP
jgi:ABC-type Zn uptake system ZnuABC Zn-binding protein ZnuA